MTTEATAGRRHGTRKRTTRLCGRGKQTGRRAAVTSHHHSALTAAEARARRPRHRRNRHLQLAAAAAHAYTAEWRVCVCVCVDVMEEKNYF